MNTTQLPVSLIRRANKKQQHDIMTVSSVRNCMQCPVGVTHQQL